MIPALLQPQYETSNPTLCTCAHVTRQDGQIERYTSIDRAVTLTGITTDSGVSLDGEYRPMRGLDLRNIEYSAELSVSNSEITLLVAEGADIDVISGVFDRATVVLFDCNYLDTSQGVNVRMRGSLGNLSIGRNSITYELRGLRQAYQQMIGIAMSKTCRNRFGVNDGRRSFCPVDLADYTETVEVTAAASRLVFTLDSAQPDDWSGNGIVNFLDGDNAGQRRKVKSFVAGVVTLAEPADAPIEVGAMVEHQAGCRLRMLEDCRDKFDSILDFNGEAYLTGIDHLTAPTEAPE